MNLLDVEDEAKIADFVCTGPKEQGFVVERCDHGCPLAGQDWIESVRIRPLAQT